MPFGYEGHDDGREPTRSRTADAGGLQLNLISLASYNETDGTVNCTLPSSPTQGKVMLRVAHNAQQYAPSPLPFELYHTLPSYLLSPNTGPLSGGTRINITADTSLDPPPRDDSCSYYADDGACDEPWICAAGTDCTDCAFHSGTQCGFRPGTDRRCRFEPVVDEDETGDIGSGSGEVGSGDDFASPPPPLITATVAATVDHGLGLICESPPYINSTAATYDVRVTLNGQQYTSYYDAVRLYQPDSLNGHAD